MPPLDPGVTPIDVDCDGTIDGYARVKLSKQVDRNGDGKIDDGWNQAPLNRTAPRSTTTTTARAPSDSTHTDFGRLLKIIALVAACIALVVAVVMILRDRARRPKKAIPEPATPTLDQAVAEVSEGLQTDPDPRQAIIDAYARLLQVLAAAGHPRFSYEGPREHLTRTLRNLAVRPSAASTLVELFEIARFSSHPLGEPERHRALEALGDVQADLLADVPPTDEHRELVTSP